MRIAIDYDGTLTAGCKEMWNTIVLAMKARGVEVIIVTSRSEAMYDATLQRFSNLLEIGVCFTSGKPKRAFMEAVGKPVDIWIDDMPETVGATPLISVKPITVRQVVEAAYGPIPKHTTCHSGYYFPYEEHPELYGYEQKPAYKGKFSGDIHVAHDGDWKHFPHALVPEVDISDCPASAFRGFFGDAYDEALAKLEEA